MGEVTFRQMRAVTVGLTQMTRMIEKLQADGWTLLPDHCVAVDNKVRLVFGSDQRGPERS